jgi:hypothetical protein
MLGFVSGIPLRVKVHVPFPRVVLMHIELGLLAQPSDLDHEGGTFLAGLKAA